MEAPLFKPTPDELLTHVAWMRELARILAGDAANGDDLAQEAWLAAERRPPTGEPRPWLRRVLANLGRMRARGERRRAAREAAFGVDEAAPSPEELLLKAESERQLAELVCALDEPYRSTLLLRYVEGLSAAAIARRLGVPSGTVRWRLKQGLDTLRAQLDARHGGERRRWRRALLLVAGPGERPLPAPLAPAAGWFSLTLTGGVVALLVAWLALRPPPPPLAPAPRGEVAARAPARRAEAPPWTRVTASVQPRAEAGELAGRVLSRADGSPIARAQLTFTRDGVAESTASDEAGAFVFRPTRPGIYELSALTATGFASSGASADGGGRQMVAERGVRLEGVTFYLERAHPVVVRVVDERGAAVAGALVRGFDNMGYPLAPLASWSTDARGEAHLTACGEERLEAVAGARLGQARVTVPDARRGTLTIKLAPAVLGDISGVVVDAAGRPIDGAQVTTHLDAQPGKPTRMLKTHSAPDGSFTFERLDALDYLVSAENGALAPASREHVRPGTRDLRLQLGAAGAISATVKDAASGRAITSFLLTATSLDPEAPRAARFHSAQVLSADGRFTLRGLLPGRWHVSAAANGALPAEPSTVEVSADGATAAVTLALVPGLWARGRVVDKVSGQPIVHAEVHFRASMFEDPVLTREDGLFAIAGVGPGRRGLIISAEGHHSRAAAVLGDVGEVGDIALEPIGPETTPSTQFVGLGFELAAENAGLRVVKIVRGSGAADAGLVEGDVIIAVEGKTLVGPVKPPNEWFLGAEGSAAHLSVQKASGGVVEVEVVRKLLLSET